jgi:hypothetical protein
MHHTIRYQLAQARIADLCRAAQQDNLARAARRAAPRTKPKSISTGGMAGPADR